MCGIAGVVSSDPVEREPAIVRGMLQLLRHRGPDDEGVDTMGDAAIGVRRLAILDVPGGHQPMWNESRRVVAVQNGEIYNFEAIRAELAGAGHAFHTGSDTEILPHGYEAWGRGLVPRLRGMFALAIWDDGERRLLLARDRFGKKPLFYARLGRGIAFASEIQALLGHPGVRRDVDAEAIGEYLTFGYVAAPRSAYAAIRKLPPAHSLVWRPGGEPEIQRYWRLSYGPKLAITMPEAVQELRSRIDEAVRIRMMSDVPIGAFLSGGLDSSTVVAFMARNSARPVQTFSIGFANRRFDESAHARTVARTFSTDHHELVVDVANADILPSMVRHLGEPFADSSIVPTYHVARITRPHVTVALNGDGGDELFGGYDRYKAALLAHATIDRLPRWLARGLSAVASRVPAKARMPRAAHRLRRFAIAAALPAETRHLRWTGYFTGALRAQISGPLVAASDEAFYRALAEAAEATGATDVAEQYMAADILSNLPNDLLVKMDIAAMANSLEGRSPLLDHELAEFVARVPARFKSTIGRSKILLRTAMVGILPDSILARGKMGFSAPVAEWLRGPLRPLISENLLIGSHAVARGYVLEAGVRRLADEHFEGRADRTIQLWNLLMLELWLRECVQDPGAEESGVAFARSDS